MGVANVVRDRLALVLVALVAGCGGPSEPTDGSTLDGGALDGGTLDGSALDGGALDGSALDGSALDGSALDGSALDGSDPGTPDGGGYPPVDAASATVGSAGGAVTRTDGVSLAIPAGVLEAELEFSILVADPAAPEYLPEGATLFAQPFQLTPEGTPSTPFELRIPLSLLPAGHAATDLVLVSVGAATMDFEDRADTGTAGFVMSPDSVTATHAIFVRRFIGPEVLHLMVLGDPAGPVAIVLPAPDGVFLNQISAIRTCSAFLGADVAALLGIAETDLDRIKIVNAEQLRGAISAEHMGRSRDPEARNRLEHQVLHIVTRTCISAARAYVYYRDAMGIPVPEVVPVNVRLWDGDGSTPYGSATSDGVTVFACMGADTTAEQDECLQTNSLVSSSAFESALVPALADAARSAFSQSAIVESVMSDYDEADDTVAHEMFHYVEHYANGVPGDGLVADGVGSAASVLDWQAVAKFFSEGMAEAAAELVFDDDGGSASTSLACRAHPRMDRTSLFATACREVRDPAHCRELAFRYDDLAPWNAEYRTSTFFRFLDATQVSQAPRDSFMARVLRAAPRCVRSDFCLGGRLVSRAALDGIFASMYPTRPSYNLRQAVGDFGAALLYSRDFERGADPSPDARGRTIADETRRLWANLTCEGSSGPPIVEGDALDRLDVGTLDDPNTLQMVVVFPPPSGPAPAPGARAAALDAAGESVVLAPFQARGVAINGLAEAFHADDDAPIVVELAASAGSTPSADVMVHLFAGNGPDGGERIARVAQLVTTAGAATSFVVTRALTSQLPAMVLVNTSDSAELTVTIRLREVVQPGVTVLQQNVPPYAATVARFAPGATATTPACDDGSALELAGPVRDAVPGVLGAVPGYWVATDAGVSFYERAHCALVETITFSDAYGTPRALDTSASGTLVAVARGHADECTPGAVSVIRTQRAPMETATPVFHVPGERGIGDLVVVRGPGGEEVIATQRGDAACGLARHLVVDLEPLRAVGASPDVATLVSTIPMPGTNTTRSVRITRTADRAWAAWVTEHPILGTPGGVRSGGGRVGILRAADHAFRIISHEDGRAMPFDMPIDVAVTVLGGVTRAYFVYTKPTATTHAAHQLHCSPTVDPMTGCNAMRWVDWNPTSGAVTLGGEWVIQYGTASAIEISEDRTRGYIAHRTGSLVEVWDFGDGTFSAFTPLGADLTVARPATALWLY